MQRKFRQFTAGVLYAYRALVLQFEQVPLKLIVLVAIIICVVVLETIIISISRNTGLHLITIIEQIVHSQIY